MVVVGRGHLNNQNRTLAAILNVFKIKIDQENANFYSEITF